MAKYRLPTNIKPTHYAITLRTDLEKEVFSGAVKIRFARSTTYLQYELQPKINEELSVQFVDAAKSITLNAAKDLVLRSESLTITSSLDALGAITFDEPSKSYDEATQRVTYTLPTELSAGTRGILAIAFAAPLTDSMLGYYKSSWSGGIYTLTQFESTHARRAVPCWDEPLLKAVFSVTMISRADTVSLSNTSALPNAPPNPSTLADHFPVNVVDALYEDVDGDSWTATTFEDTPRMSTYLLIFANGAFEHRERSYTSPISGKTRPLRVYATKDIIGNTQFVLDVTARAVPLFEKVFDVEYPLSKLDTLVAHDFDIGAMENWGLITGRTSAMLVNPDSQDLTRRIRVASTQTHEVSHMWFGDITTMAWWDNLYLKEGFATVMGESIILNRLFPEWRPNSQFINENLNQALRLDAKPSSHPIEVPLPDPNQINQIFDSLSYAKGASVLRMLSEYVGEDEFLHGVSLYLKKHSYANTVSADLWEGVAQATGKDIGAFMHHWVASIGFPVLTVTETGDGKGVVVRQDRFLEDGKPEEKENQTIWSVPLSLLTSRGLDRSAVLDKREATFEVDTSKPWKLNGGTIGVYRVLYTPERLQKIAAQATAPNSGFTLEDRIGLVHDAMALAKSGHLKVSAALAFIKAWSDEKEHLVWEGISDNLSLVLATWWENERVQTKLNAFRRALYAPIAKRLGVDYGSNESPDITQLRTIAVGGASAAGDEAVLAELKTRFGKYVAGDEAAVPSDLLGATFTQAVEHGGNEEYDAVLKIYEASKGPSVHIAAIRALAATQDHALLERTLELIGTNSRNQDVVYFFGGLNANYKARRRVRDYFEHEYDTLSKRFEGTSAIRSFVRSTYSGYSTQEDLKHAQEFFETKDTAWYSMALAQAFDSIKARIRWIERSTDDIQSFLDDWEKEA